MKKHTLENQKHLINQFTDTNLLLTNDRADWLIRQYDYGLSTGAVLADEHRLIVDYIESITK